jgi:hypothetical protein
MGKIIGRFSDQNFGILFGIVVQGALSTQSGHSED